MDIYAGTICNADREPFEGEIIVGLGKIWTVQKAGTSRMPITHDYRGKLIFPGMVDLHIHAREDQTGKQMHKEEYLTALDAALHGGVVATGAMGNTPDPITTLDRYDWHQQRLSTLNHPVTLFNYIMLKDGSQPFTKRVAYKGMLCESVGDAYFRNREEVVRTLPNYAGPFYDGRPISFHVEDQQVNKAHEHEPTHSDRRPRLSVDTALGYLLPCIEELDLNAKLCHWSTGGESFSMIREHRERMARAGKRRTTLEVSPLHLLFDSDMLRKHPELWPYVQMNPAIQTEKDRLELIEGLRTGVIDYLATDHAPHTLDEKFVNFRQFADRYTGLSNEDIYKSMLTAEPELCKQICCKNGMSGAPWLDTYALVATYLMKEHNFTPTDIARVTAYNPGKFVNQLLEQPVGFGRIANFHDANFTIIDMNKPTTVHRDEVKSKCGWSPLEGRTFPGSIAQVVIKGKEMLPRAA